MARRNRVAAARWVRRNRAGAGAAAATLVAAGALAVVLLGGGERHARPPALSMGVNAQFLFRLPPQDWGPSIDAMARAHVKLVRYDALWERAEPRPPTAAGHTYDWTHFDAVVGSLAAKGIRWMPIVDYSAFWAGKVPGDRWSPPAKTRDFSAYARALVSRYGRGGSFWDEHGELEALPVTAYEIWNEPSHEAFWHPAPDPKAYFGLYLAARSAIHAEDPGARVVVGGLTRKGRSFLREAVRSRPGVGASVDAVGFHPYGYPDDDVKLVLQRIASLRRTMVGIGMASVPIDITEVGWTTSGPYAAVPDAVRATYYRRLVSTLLRASCGVETVIAHTWITPEQNPADREQWFGLYHGNATPTAAGRGYERAQEQARDFNGRRYGPAKAPCERTGLSRAARGDARAPRG